MDNWVAVSSPEPDLNLENEYSILICLMRLWYLSPVVFCVYCASNYPKIFITFTYLYLP